MEWLAVALTPEQLQEEWVCRGVEALVDMLGRQPLDAFSDGGLYHAAHAFGTERRSQLTSGRDGDWRYAGIDAWLFLLDQFPDDRGRNRVTANSAIPGDI